MAEFAYNKFKSASMGNTLFELNCGYHPWVSVKDECNACSKPSSANELAVELEELINVYCENQLHAQELQKRSHDKRVKSCSYVPSETVWLNSKHIKAKRNQKLEAKFFRLY